MKISTIAWGLVLTFAAGGVAWSQTLADVARKEEERRKAVQTAGKVYTNEDLRRYPVTTPGPSAQIPAPKPTADAKPAEEARAGAVEEKPSIDQGEEHWRRRMSDARAARARSETYQEAMQNRLQVLVNDFYNQPDPALRSAIWAQRTRVFDDLEKLKKDIVAQDEAIAKVEEDARKANIPPGWIR